MLPVNSTAEGAVCISYKDLVSQPAALLDSIEKAFGSDPSCLGIIVVKDLPEEYAKLRERLLKLADQFASLPEETREKYADASSRYSFGWSHGKEIMNGKPDTLKGSFYANPIVDAPTVPSEDRKAYPEYYRDNIWPAKNEAGIEGFEDAFKDLGRFIFKTGCELASACQPFASAFLRDKSLSLHDLIAKSQTTKARLLHYFPPPPSAKNVNYDDEPVDSWCGFHLDHSLLTGLCSALYLSHPPTSGHGSKATPTVISAPTSSSGLYIRSRGGELTKVSIPVNCLAFQTGEALELATEGRLRATPHCVRVVPAAGDSNEISRETFALFMQPDIAQQISAKETYGQFSKRIFEDHYGPEAKTNGTTQM